MKLEMRRVVIFTPDLERMSRFYRDVLGLDLLNSEAGWRSFSAGGCDVALHAGKSTVGTRSPKLVFFAQDVSAARALLMQRGAGKMGKIMSTGSFEMCDGRDPDGNRFQISSRRA